MLDRGPRRRDSLQAMAHCYLCWVWSLLVVTPMYYLRLVAAWAGLGGAWTGYAVNRASCHLCWAWDPWWVPHCELRPTLPLAPGLWMLSGSCSRSVLATAHARLGSSSWELQYKLRLVATAGFVAAKQDLQGMPRPVMLVWGLWTFEKFWESPQAELRQAVLKSC